MVILPGVLSLVGGFVVYFATIKVPWEDVADQLEALRSDNEAVEVIVPDETRYWGYFVTAGLLVVLITGFWYGVFSPRGASEISLFGASFLFGLLLMFGSPLSGSVERTLLVYKGLFAVAGLGLLFGGVYPLVTEGSFLSGAVALAGLFLLYFGFGKISWEFMREVVEEYRALEHPSTLGAEQITERVQERWDENDTS